MDVASPPQPRLGDPLQQFLERLGRPRHRTSVMDQPVLAFEYPGMEGMEVLVLFQDDRACAVHGSYPFPAPEHVVDRLMATFAPAGPAGAAAAGGPAGAKLYITDRGWTLATPACPPELVEQLAALSTHK